MHSITYYGHDMKTTKCSSMDEWIRKMWYIYICDWILVSHRKKKPAVCENIDGHGKYCTKGNKPEKDKYCMVVSLTCRI